MFYKKSFFRIFSILFVLVFILALVGPANAAPPVLAMPGEPATVSKAPSLLQYTAGGHVLGFDVGKVYLAGLDHALMVEFVGGQGKAPVGTAASTTTDTKVGSAPALGRVLYESVWNGVDIIYTSNQTGLVESTYVVQPGADPADIRLKYNTPVQLLKDGTLLFAFETGTLTESAPIAFQEIEGKRVPVEVHFSLNDGQVGFTVGMYDPDYSLTIDPTYAWHTFYGSLGQDHAYAITIDDGGNIYMAGYSDASWNGSNSASPLNAHSGNGDIVIAKLDSEGVYQWHSFYGSADWDEGYAITIGIDKNIYVVGQSNSTWNGPELAVPLNSHAGGIDIVVLKLNSFGIYQWHTFYGSSRADFGYAVTIDGSGNVVVAGMSYSSWNGPNSDAPLNGHAGEVGENDADIVVVKLNSFGIYQWHTFYGAPNADLKVDEGRAIVNDGNDNIYVVGSSYASWNGPNFVAPLNAYAGEADIVVVKLNSSGIYQWHTFYGSSSGYDLGQAIIDDANGNIYVLGSSGASWKGPNDKRPLNYHSGASSDFVAIKLTSEGTFQWHTFYGSNSNDYSKAITIDGNGNLYIVGRSLGDWNGPGDTVPLIAYVGSGYYENSVVIKLDNEGAYQWHSFVGPTTMEAVTKDDSENIYLAGSGWVNWNGPSSDVPLNEYSGGLDIVATKLLTNDEQDIVCENVPPITPEYDHLDVLYSSTDIDPYKFEVADPYTSIEVALTPPIISIWDEGDFALSLFKGCDNSSGQPWDISQQAIHIGRRHIHIGGEEDPNIYVRFNVGKATGTYYLTVQVPENGNYSPLPYRLRVDLQPADFTMVDTLILYNSTRFKAEYGLDAASQIMDELTRLAEHPKVNGLIIQPDQFPAVTTAYTNWDNATVVNGNESSYTTNVTAANVVSDNIRIAMRDYMVNSGKYITDNGYVVIVGDDDQIPYRRLDIKPPLIEDYNWKLEYDYFSILGDIPNTPIDAALMANRTLSDNYYGDYQDRQGLGNLPQLSVGRLLDTPVRIQNMIESFLEHNGAIDLSIPTGKAAIAGYTFLADSAQKMCTTLQSNGGLTTDCTLIDTTAIPNKFTAAQLSQKFIGDAPNVAGFYGHTNHSELFTPVDPPLAAQQISSASFDPASYLWWVIGCQSGLVMPKSENYPLSLTQALGDHNVTYLGNTGWAWGSDGPQTYSELLYQLVANHLRSNQVGVGEALRLAKQDYFFNVINNAYGQGKSYTNSYYDDKVIAEATLYGLPMLKFTFPGTVSAQSIAKPSETVATLDLANLALPSNFHPLEITPSNLTQVEQEYNGNTYFTNEQGEFGASSKSPLLAQSEYFNFDTSLGRAKGVIWKGGSYTVQAGNNPLVLIPTQLNATPGAEPAFSGTYPLLPVALAGLEKLDGTFSNHLTFQTGQYLGTETNGTLRLFADMDFLVGLWKGTSTDETPPTIGQLTSNVTNNTMHIELPITDTSGVYKAFVTYAAVNEQLTSGLWQSKELTGASECTAGQHTYSLDLPLTGRTNYFIQVMDCAGNVSVQFNNGKYFETLTLLPTPWIGGISISSNKNIVAVGRPHIGSEITAYDGFSEGAHTAYVPMLFKNAFANGGYDSAFYIQNVDSALATISIEYYDSTGDLTCTAPDIISPLASKGYWLPGLAASCLPEGWVGGAVVTSDKNIVANGRPHINGEVMTYDSFSAGSLTSYLPMLFKNAFANGGYDSAFYVQNVDPTNTAALDIKYYDSMGSLTCTVTTETVAPLASKGYWLPALSAACIPDGWVGGVVITSTAPIVTVGRPHIGTQITTYTGFSAGSGYSSVPMLFKNAFANGAYDSAFYVQNLNPSTTANLDIKYYDLAGTLTCTVTTETIAPLASKGYWLPTLAAACLPDGWVGGAVVTSNVDIVAIGRPHIGAQVMTYNGFTAGSPSSYLPMLFKDAFANGSYDSAFYIQNTESTAATVLTKFYDNTGALTCMRSDTLPGFSTLSLWTPSLTCVP